jgi:hypothetical protein
LPTVVYFKAQRQRQLKTLELDQAALHGELWVTTKLQADFERAGETLRSVFQPSTFKRMFNED